MGRHRRRSRLAFWVGTFLVATLPSHGGKRRASAEAAEVREDIEATVPIPVYTRNGPLEESSAPQLAAHTR
jgi:hypothetical protein